MSPHEGFVRRPDVGVRSVPAAVAEVGEAGLVPTKVRTLLQPAHTAQRVLEIRIDLELYNTRLDMAPTEYFSYH